MNEEEIAKWIFESKDNNLDLAKLRVIRDVVILKIDEIAIKQTQLLREFIEEKR